MRRFLSAFIFSCVAGVVLAQAPTAPVNLRIVSPAAPPSGSGPHTYYNMLLKRAEFHKAFSWRDQAQLMTYRAGSGLPASCNYDPTSDTDPRKQDAAKCIIPAGIPSLKNQIRIPLGTSDGTSYLFTWDAWAGAENRQSVTGILNYKSFQFTSKYKVDGADNIMVELNNDWQKAPTVCGLMRDRYYGRSLDGTTTPNVLTNTIAGPNISNLDPVKPFYGQDYTDKTSPNFGVGFAIACEVWTRYWVLVEQRANDFDLVTVWVADENRNAVKILDRLQFNLPWGLVKFWVELNTSTDLVTGGDRIWYVRNFVQLNNVVDVNSLLQRPVK